MNQSQLSQHTAVHHILSQQMTKNRLPHTTLIYGECLNSCFKTLPIITETILHKALPHDVPPSHDIQEPLEDVLVLNSDTSIKLEQLKSLFKRIQYGPSNSPYLIAFIHPISRLSSSAMHALLKTIEAPPDNTLFFLTAQNKHTIMRTICSRAQHIHVPESQTEKSNSINQWIAAIEERIAYECPRQFFARSSFEKTIYIQSLPNDAATISDLLRIWQSQLFMEFQNLSKKELIFLEKIIEIISKLPYNVNGKLHLLHASLFGNVEDLQ